MEEQRHTGRCLCGGVAFAVRGPLRDVINCHCHRCRRWTGHHMAATSAAVADIEFEREVEVESEVLLTWFRPD